MYPTEKNDTTVNFIVNKFPWVFNTISQFSVSIIIISFMPTTLPLLCSLRKEIRNFTLGASSKPYLPALLCSGVRSQPEGSVLAAGYVMTQVKGFHFLWDVLLLVSEGSPFLPVLTNISCGLSDDSHADWV